MHRRLLPAALILLLTVVVGCGGADSPDDDGADSPEEGNVDDGTDELSELDAVVEQAIDDAAARFDVDRGQIEVLTAEAVTWRSGALGCPQPGTSYTQALVDGYRIALSVADEQVDYHAGQGEPFYCENPQAPAQE